MQTDWKLKNRESNLNKIPKLDFRSKIKEFRL